jgi:hypothetical protein
MSTLSRLNDNDIGKVYYQTYYRGNHKQPLKYMGDTITDDGRHLKRFTMLKPPFASLYYIPEDKTFDIQEMPNLPDPLHLKISSFVGNLGGKNKKRKSKKKRINKNKNKKSKRVRKRN